jgi:GH25 family lysozyme M1 (1,4-beta-N-acetylmuramidase)
MRSFLVMAAWLGWAITLAAQTGGEAYGVQGTFASSLHGYIHWQQVYQGGVRFAYLRMQDGLLPDADFAHNARRADSAGLLVGACIVLRASQDVAAQLKHYQEQTQGLPLRLAPLLLIRTDDGQTTFKVVNQTRKAVTLLSKLAGRPPVLGATLGVLGRHLDGLYAGELPLWIMDIGTQQPTVPQAYSPWRFWHYTEEATLPGFSSYADRVAFFGTIAELHCLAAAPPAE